MAVQNTPYIYANVLSSELQCSFCTAPIKALSRYCSQCGKDSKQDQTEHNSYTTNAPQSVPDFAPLSHSAVPGHLVPLLEEQNKLTVLLIRERLFLYMHWIIFLGIQTWGSWLAVTCYNDFGGDEVSKSLMSLTPLFFINLIGLICIVPIRGCRKEIKRLKERLTYNKFQLEYDHLM